LEAEEFVTVARIRRARGRCGEVLAELFTDFPERFRQREDLLLYRPGGQRRLVGLEKAWFHKGNVVLKFAGIDSIAAAKTLAGCEVQIPVERRLPLGGSAVYWSDLPGCRVVQGKRELGVVRHLDPTIGTPVLVVDTPQGELLIPFAEEICRRVDLAGRRIEVELPEGLEDLNR